MNERPAPRIPTQLDTPADDRVAFHIDNGSTGSPAQRFSRAQHRAEHVANLRRLGDPTALDPADLDNPAVFEPLDPATLAHYTADQTVNHRDTIEPSLAKDIADYIAAHGAVDALPGQAANPRINPETVGEVATPDTVTALVGMHADANQRLAADLAATPPASPASVAAILAAQVGEIAHLLGDHADRQDETDPDRVIDLDAGATVLPQHHALHDAVSRLRLTSAELRGLAVRLLAAGLAVLACGGLAVSTAPRAEALAIPLTPLRVVVAGPVTTITLPTISTTTTYGRHVVTLSAPQGGRTLIVAAGTSTGPLVTVTGRPMSAALRPGAQTWQLWDAGDQTTRSIAVTVLRQSRVTRGQAVAFPGGIIVTGRAAHYDLGSGQYRGDQLSVVTVALRNAVTGRTARIDAHTAPDGTFLAIANVDAGLYSVTATRAPGANVTGAVSGSRYVVASPMAPARGE